MSDDYREFDRMKVEERIPLEYWIRLAIIPASRYSNRDSYFLKHEYERQTGLYVTNGEFKGAMLAMGYEPGNRASQNWMFRIKRSNSKFKPQTILNVAHSPVFEFDISHVSDNELRGLQMGVDDARTYGRYKK